MNDADFIFQCGCGNILFLIRKNGDVECPECEGALDRIEVKFQPELTVVPKDGQ